MDAITLSWQNWWGVDSEITEDIPKKKKTVKVKGFGESPSEEELKNSEFFKKGIK